MRAILTYHSIDDSGSPISVAPEEFRAHVRWLVSGTVRVVPLAELATLPPDEDAVALTFDDAFENFSTMAAPLLHEHRLPATVFVVSGRVGRDNAWGDRPDPRVPTLPLLDWTGLGWLMEEGIEIGAHTRTHPHLTRISPAMLEDELLGSADEIRRKLGMTVREIAYPYGDVNGDVVAAARRHFVRGYTTHLQPLAREDDPLQLPRLDMYYLRAPGWLESWGSARFGQRLWLRAQARRLRQVLSGPAGGW
jgi:peptidoglycan/xylan/chitin deacetylase (PgdA/CDA1 family)